MLPVSLQLHASKVVGPFLSPCSDQGSTFRASSHPQLYPVESD